MAREYRSSRWSTWCCASRPARPELATQAAGAGRRRSAAPRRGCQLPPKPSHCCASGDSSVASARRRHSASRTSSAAPRSTASGVATTPSPSSTSTVVAELTVQHQADVRALDAQHAAAARRGRRGRRLAARSSRSTRGCRRRRCRDRAATSLRPRCSASQRWIIVSCACRRGQIPTTCGASNGCHDGSSGSRPASADDERVDTLLQPVGELRVGHRRRAGGVDVAWVAGRSSTAARHPPVDEAHVPGRGRRASTRDTRARVCRATPRARSSANRVPSAAHALEELLHRRTLDRHVDGISRTSARRDSRRAQLVPFGGDRPSPSVRIWRRRSSPAITSSSSTRPATCCTSRRREHEIAARAVGAARRGVRAARSGPRRADQRRSSTASPRALADDGRRSRDPTLPTTPTWPTHGPAGGRRAGSR